MPLLSLSQLPSTQASLPKHLAIVARWTGQTEAKPNRSPLIDSINRYVGNPLGSSYCAATVVYALHLAGATYPTERTGLASRLITKRSISAKKVLMGVQSIPAGSIIIWRKGETIFGHAGFVVETWQGATGKTWEANTSPGKQGDQRNGDGMYYRTRTIYPLEYFRITHFTPVSYD